MKIGGEPIRRRCEIALSTFDEHQRRLQENRFTDAVLSCLWLKLVRSAPTDLPNENWCSKRRFPEMNRSPFRNSEERGKKPFLSSALRYSLPAMSPLRGSLALSRRKILRKTSRTRIAVNNFADDLKFIEQVVHTDGQGHSHRRFRGRLCSSLTAYRTTKVVLRALRTYR